MEAPRDPAPAPAPEHHVRRILGTSRYLILVAVLGTLIAGVIVAVGACYRLTATGARSPDRQERSRARTEVDPPA